MTTKEMIKWEAIKKYHTSSYNYQSNREAYIAGATSMVEKIEGFIEGLKKYEMECGERLCDDERTTAELFTIYLKTL